ncbi:hypothetical protein TNCV_4360921 [Trichonephila clavipes]|nr:hypothetical protein TNCV_4360921 [Trichonephila clavipes]
MGNIFTQAINRLHGFCPSDSDTNLKKQNCLGDLSSQKCLPVDVVEAMRPVFRDLANPELLKSVYMEVTFNQSTGNDSGRYWNIQGVLHMLKNRGRRGLRAATVWRRMRRYSRADVTLAAPGPLDVPHFPAPTIFATGDAPWTHLGWYQLRFDEATNLPFSARSPYPL